MRAMKIAGANVRLGPPENWDPSKHGKCAALDIRRTGPLLQSEWLPTDQERALIARGAPIILTIFGNAHPPVALEVSGATDQETDDG